MTGKTPQQVLLDAADLLERDGWCQGDTRDAAGRMCAVGAINKAATGNAYGMNKLFSLAYNRLSTKIGRRFPLVSRWNDAPGRTAAEVIAALRRAAS